MEAEAVLGLVMLGFILLLILVVGAILLRAACWFYNLMAGGSASPPAGGPPGVVGPPPPAAAPPGTVSPPAPAMMPVATGNPSGVPSPGFGKALGITAITVLVQIVVSVLLAVVAISGEMTAPTINLISLPVSFIVAASMICVLLPTTFGRALLVAIIQFIALIVCIFLALFVLGGVVGIVNM